jgi:hypothetical protein
VVDSGTFRITSSRRLLSTVYTERPAKAKSSEEESSPLSSILKGIIESTLEEEEEEGSAPPSQEAQIHTLSRIGSAFEIDLTLVSNSTWGSMEIVLLGGDPPKPRYRVVYHAAPSAERPIEIVRERGTRSYLIETATKYPSLDDGAAHRLQWIRDSKGNMRVLADGKEVLTTVEVYHRGPFTGLALTNLGGTYEWGPINVFKAQDE